MRQLTVQVPRGKAELVIRAASERGGRNLVSAEARGTGQSGRLEPVDLVTVRISNRQVEPLLEELQREVEDLRITVVPVGVMTLHPPQEEAPGQVTDVSARSPLEVYLSGLMSVGSWGGLVGYSLAAALVVWNGLYTGTAFLLVASMLIAPYAGPAMTLALGTARGDRELIGRSVLRYATALLITVVTCFLVSLVLGQEVASQMMVERSMISEVTIFLPLVAGAAGALNLVRSENDSLVSGAATGMLVAASLAPPAGVVGMGLAIGEWNMAGSGAFLLCLQLVGINFSGAIVFRYFGLTPQGVRYTRGRGWAAWTAWLISGAAVAGLLWWQFSTSPDLRRSTREQRAVAVVQEAMDASGLGRLVRARAEFTRADIAEQNTLYVEVIVQRPAGQGEETEVKRRLARMIQQRLLEEEANVTPLVEVILLEAPG